MNIVRYGILGCGDVTEVKSGPAFQKAEGSALTVVMRRDKEKLESYARRHGVARFTTDYQALLQDEDVDVVYIATPPKWHEFYTLEAARAKKAVYVEKPMGMTVAQCRTMRRVCQAQGVPLFVAYYRREHEKFKTVKAILERGDIGEVRSFAYLYVSPVPQVPAHRAWLYDKEIAGGGKLFDIGSHMVDTLRFLLGEVDTVHGFSANQSKALEVEDVVSGVLHFEGGVQGTLQLTFTGSEDQDQLLIFGSKGSLKLSLMDNAPVTVTTAKGAQELSFMDLPHVHQPLVQRITDALRGRDHLEDTGLSALRTQAVLEALATGEPLQGEND